MMKPFLSCLKTAFEKREKILQVTDAAGCTLRWNESTHYVRAIAVFKISLTLCVLSICRAFGQKGGKPWGRRGRLISSDLQTLRSLVTFSQAETQEDAGYTLCFFTPAFSLRFFLHVHTEAHTHSKPARQAGRQRSPFFLSHTLKRTHTNTPNACVHTPRLSLATELPLQWDHCFKNKAVGFKSWNIL